MMNLKTLHVEAIPSAMAKAERYRLLNDAAAAESICHDILHVDPENQPALIMLILTLTDQFGSVGSSTVDRVREFLPRLKLDYQRYYYSGIICERWAKAQLSRSYMGSSAVAFDWLRDAMNWFEKAEAICPAGDDESILRWNACLRSIIHFKLEAQSDPDHTPSFGE